MSTAIDWSAVFAESLTCQAFLDRHANPQQRERWDAMPDRIKLTGEQTALLGSFVRKMHVFCLSGAWCGDCIQQCPIFLKFAEACPAIDLKFLDRDAREDVRDALSLNGGHRVPMVVFLSEDFQEVARFGDRTLSGYRRLASQQLGSTCPTGLVPPDDDALAAMTSDWLDQFERAHLILRLSPRLRQLHND